MLNNLSKVLITQPLESREDLYAALGTIRDADQIVMMSPSGTVESIGNHEELMESSPRYRSF